MPRKLATAAAATLLAAGLVAGFSQPASAGSATDVRSAAPVAASPEMFAAMQRDLNLTPRQALDRMAADAKAADTGDRLRQELGAAFGGGWLAPEASQFVVGITDASQAQKVRAAGAQPRIVARSESQLEAAKSTLDSRADLAPSSVTGWYVDVVNNTVVVNAALHSAQSAKTFVAATGVDANTVRVVESDEAPRLLFDVRGGDAYYINNASRCSVGFSVAGGYVTAGHCGRVGARTAGYNRVASGNVAGSSFPGNDYGWVRTNASWVPRGVVNNYRGGTVRVAGNREAAVGASICRSGSTSGWRCGTVQAKNQTVRYPQGTVTGLTRTNACAEGGDSGGSWLSGSQAQGVTSGGSGNCRVGGTTFFQPVNEILSRFGLRLVTS